MEIPLRRSPFRTIDQTSTLFVIARLQLYPIWWKKINRKRKAQKKHKKEPKISLNFFDSKYTLQPGVDKRDFKQRERGRRRGPQALKETPNNHLRMTGGKKFDVLRSAPTWNEVTLT